MITKENTLALPIKQKFFNEILAGTKTKEYREIKDTTFKKYLETETVNGETRIVYFEELISDEEFDKYPNDPIIYNGGVYPYAPREYKFLRLFAGYKKDRDTLVVEVKDITFEVMKTTEGKIVRFDIDAVEREDGDFTFWQVVYHLGKVVESDIKKNR